MNQSTTVSLPVAADLSASVHAAVKLTSAGIDLAGVLDIAIGTCVHPNLPAAFGESVVGRAATVFLTKGNGFHFVTLANNVAAISMGDALVLSASGTYLRNATLTASAGTASTGSFAITSHGLVVGDAVRLISQTGATAGITVGGTYYVITVTDANNVIVSATKGGTANTWTTNISAATLQKMNDSAGNIVLAVDSAPAASTGGVIRALFL